MFSSSFLLLEFPLIVVITVIIHCPSPVRCRHLSPPSPLQQYLIVVSLSSVVHHIVFIVVAMLHIVIIASSSHPPSYWLDRIIHSPTLVGFCLSDIFITVGPSSASTAPN